MLIYTSPQILFRDATKKTGGRPRRIDEGELAQRQERRWADELESAWGIIRQVAKLLLAGNTMTDAVVRELIEGTGSA